jgi:hypothetical protein
MDTTIRRPYFKLAPSRLSQIQILSKNLNMKFRPNLKTHQNWTKGSPQNQELDNERCPLPLVYRVVTFFIINPLKFLKVWP